MRRYAWIALAATALVSACKKDSDEDQTPKAHVMFVNAAMDVGDSLRAQVNNATVSTIPFSGNSGYINAEPGTAKYGFATTGSGSLYQEQTLTTSANSYYSVFTGGNLNQKTIVSTTDDLTAPSAGMAKVRFVNMSPANISAKTFVGSQALDTDVNFGVATSFKQVNAGTYNIVIGELPNTGTLNNFTLASGKIYTFVFTGASGGTGTYALKLTAIANN